MDFVVEYFEASAGTTLSGKQGTVYVCKNATLTAASMADAAQQSESLFGHYIKSIQWAGDYLPKED